MDKNELLANYLSMSGKDAPFLRRLFVGIALILGIMGGADRADDTGSIVAGIIVGVVVAWVALTGSIFLAYAGACCTYGGTSLVWLPWRQPWTWALVALTLPWLPFWLISALRLAINWKRTRPNPLPTGF